MLRKNQQNVFEIIQENQPISKRDIITISRQRNLGIDNMTKVLNSLLNAKHAVVMNGGLYSINPDFHINDDNQRNINRHRNRVREVLPYVPNIPTFLNPVTLYEFSYEYLLLQTMSLHSVNREEAIAIVNMYMEPNVLPPYTFESLLEETVQSIQTASRKINIINYLGNRVALSRAFYNYSLPRILSSSVDVLYNNCVREIGPSINNSETTWKNMIEGLKDNAAIMSRFATPNDYRNYIEDGNFSNTHNMTFVDYQSNVHGIKESAMLNINGYGIKGFGPAITPNYLKEIGFSYGKPDTHLLAIAEIVPGWLTQDNTFEEGLQSQVEMAQNAGFGYVNKYVLDKVLWLICSGFYFKHRNSRYGGGARRLKEPFLQALDHAIRTGAIII